jgi:hypothetical protein
MYLRDKDGKLKGRMSNMLVGAVLNNVPGDWKRYNFKNGTSQDCFVISEPMWCGDASRLEVHLNAGDYLARNL